jgi:uncharacterized protein
MPHRPVIDGFEFARAGLKLGGEWPISDFPRWRDALASDSGWVRYELEGVPEAKGRPALRLSVQGTLALTCQRCLERLDYPVRIAALLLLYAGEREIGEEPQDADGPDRIVAGREMAVHDMIEDEVLLAIPYAPRHAQCESRASGETAARQQPFAGLRGLLGAKKH